MTMLTSLRFRFWDLSPLRCLNMRIVDGRAMYRLRGYMDVRGFLSDTGHQHVCNSTNFIPRNVGRLPFPICTL